MRCSPKQRCESTDEMERRNASLVGNVLDRDGFVAHFGQQLASLTEAAKRMVAEDHESL